MRPFEDGIRAIPTGVKNQLDLMGERSITRSTR